MDAYRHLVAGHTLPLAAALAVACVAAALAVACVAAALAVALVVENVFAVETYWEFS